MRYTMKNTDGSRACSIEYGKKTWFESQVPCGYTAEVAAYAACRYLRHLPQVRDRLIAEAVRRGLSQGKAGRAVRMRVHTRAAALSLPGDEAWIHLRVGQGLVEILGVKVKAERKAEPKAERPAAAAPVIRAMHFGKSRKVS